MVSLQTPAVTVATWRDRAATGLMLLVTLGAFVAFVTSIGAATTASPATQVVEIWRMYGFIVFAGLFMLLAFWPRRYAGIWELVILNKVALSITGLVLLGQAITDAQTILIFDGSLAVITIVAYVLAKGYAAWKRTGEK